MVGCAVGGAYHILAGRECARALATLQLMPKLLTSKTNDLDEAAQNTLAEWIMNFKGQYPVVGQVGHK